MSNTESPLFQPLADFYRGKTVAIAGGAGFVGYQLTKVMSEVVGPDGTVIVLDNFSRGQNICRNDNVLYMVATEYGSYYPYKVVKGGDIRALYIFSGVDVSYQNYSYMLEGVDVFFNLAAAVAGVLHNASNHLQMYDDNVRLLSAPLRACEQAGVPVFFQTSSVCVYSEDHQSPCDESCGWGGDPHVANAGYAEAKRDGERMARWSKIERVVIGRPSNVIGPFDYFDELAHVLPAFIRRALETEGDFVSYGNPEASREFIFSFDVATGMAYAAAFGQDRTVYNIGTSGQNTITMLSLATKIIELAHVVSGGRMPERDVVFDNSKGGGDSIRYSNAERLRGLGWRPIVGLDWGIWYAFDEYKRRDPGMKSLFGWTPWLEPTYESMEAWLKNVEFSPWLNTLRHLWNGDPNAEPAFPGLDSMISPPPYEEPVAKPIEDIDYDG